MPSLISESSKKALQKVVDNSLNPIIEYQNVSKQKFLSDTKSLVEEIKIIYTGPTGKLAIKEQIGGKEITLFNVLSVTGGINNQVTFEKTNLNDKSTASFFTRSLYANFKGQGEGIYGKIGATPLDPFSQNVNNDGFFSFFVNQLNNVDPVTSTDIGDWINSLNDETFEKDLNKVFIEAEKIKKESAELFDQSVNEGGKNTNVFASNLKAMKKIIKSVKEN